MSNIPVKVILPHTCPHCSKDILIHLGSTVITLEQSEAAREEVIGKINNMRFTPEVKEAMIAEVPAYISPEDVSDIVANFKKQQDAPTEEDIA